jgi:hypothetical protein
MPDTRCTDSVSGICVYHVAPESCDGKNKECPYYREHWEESCEK